jgi:acetolactate synthase regulatory subunit
MKQDINLVLIAENNFSVLNRIVNILNRRRVRIRRMDAHEEPQDFRRGSVSMVIHTTADMACKVKLQLEKLIEVEAVSYHIHQPTQERPVPVVRQSLHAVVEDIPTNPDHV